MKIEIDPEKFALALLQKEKEPSMTNEKFVKENLLLYLEAIFVVSEFNKLESQQFKNMKENEIRDIISEILSARLN
ncbi:MAG: hypothetical protein K0Q87_4392 [Neobacillus sp.]|jgi:hypothetical protein|nr:hypothetical protein [Neobacillus sp.]